MGETLLPAGASYAEVYTRFRWQIPTNFNIGLPIRPIRSQLPEFQAADRESPPSPAVVGSLPVTLIRV